VKLFTCELAFKKFNGVLFKFLNQKFHSAKAFHIPSTAIDQLALEKPAKDTHMVGVFPPHHLQRKLATLFRQPRRQRCPGSYLSYFYICIRKFLTN
jgi:hypothetical protein